MQLTDLNEDCRVVHAQLLDAWLGDVDEETSPALLSHFSKCRGCLKRWIAIQAAADLALVSTPVDSKLLGTVDSGVSAGMSDG
ncbi:MAG: hypothetical protein AB8G99_21735 [Planctomycetaceae bacterium]